MESIIFKIGRHRLYPYACVILVTVAFLYTDPFSELNWRYLMSYFGAITGLLCVIFLARGKNSGNLLGLLASVGESSGNILGGNLGAAMPSFYYAITHIFAFFHWKQHQAEDETVQTRSLNEKHFFWVLLFLFVTTFLNIYLTGVFDIENDVYQLMGNCFIFALAIVAQFLLIKRFSFNWFLWILLNILVISLNIYTHNPIIATQYGIYLFNSTYGLFEWNRKVKA